MRFDSIHVTKSESYGFFGEPGASAEWRLTVTVNDQSRTWNHDDTRDGGDYSLGWDFPVDLINAGTSISIRSSGFEEDDSSANDPLPSAGRTHGSSDNWGIGSTRQLSASNSDFDYTLNYTVTCLSRPNISVISRAEAVQAVQARLEAQGVQTERGESELLTTFINKMSARGIQLKEIHPGMLVWEGATAIHQLIPEVFPVKQTTKGTSAQ